MQTNSINILLLNWNSSDDIKICIENILKSDYQDYRIILIDNDSKEIDKKNILELFNKYKNDINIHLVMNDKNYGYAGGNNRGYEYISKMNLAGNILILNPDVSIMENTLTEMMHALKEDVGIVMTKTLISEGTILYDSIKFNGLKQKWEINGQDSLESDYAAGSCMLLKRSLIDQIGLFDEIFFMYWEEVDLSLRIKEIGYKIISTTKTYIVRKHNSNDRNIKAKFYLSRNAILLYKKHTNIKFYDLITYIVPTVILSFIQTVKKFDFKYSIYTVKGILSGITTAIQFDNLTIQKDF